MDKDLQIVDFPSFPSVPWKPTAPGVKKNKSIGPVIQTNQSINPNYKKKKKKINL
jgi:hypothetical protein